MALEIRLRDEASQELRDAMFWYEDVQTGLGIEFLRTIEAVLAVIARHPRRYPAVYGDCRKALIRRFPYAIYYIEIADHIQVLAIYHGRRDPATLSARLLDSDK